MASGLDVVLRWAVFEAAALAVHGGASLVTARRVLASRTSGSAGYDGTLVLEIFNHHPSASLSVLVLDRLPWFARILTHTLRVESRANDGQVSSRSLNDMQGT